MALNSTAPMNALKTLIQGLAGVQTVYIGIPKAPTARLVAFVTMGGHDPFDKAANHLLRRRARYRVLFAYALDGEEDDAEAALAAVVDLFEVAIFAARDTWKNDATLGSIELVDASGGDDPRYALLPGDEFRVYPITVTIAQQANY